MTSGNSHIGLKESWPEQASRHYSFCHLPALLFMLSDCNGSDREPGRTCLRLAVCDVSGRPKPSNWILAALKYSAAMSVTPQSNLDPTNPVSSYYWPQQRPVYLPCRLQASCSCQMPCMLTYTLPVSHLPSSRGKIAQPKRTGPASRIPRPLFLKSKPLLFRPRARIIFFNSVTLPSTLPYFTSRHSHCSSSHLVIYHRLYRFQTVVCLVVRVVACFVTCQLRRHSA
jgi:hypothetical protein